MERADLDSGQARDVVGELRELVADLDRRELPISSWYGSLDPPGAGHSWERVNRGWGYQPLDNGPDDQRFPWFLCWEIAWLVMHNDLRPGQRVLDLGGSSSLFSYLLAARGLDVTAVDRSTHLVENANQVARRTGWRLRNRVMEIEALDLSEPFDHITSVCVFEHLPVSARVEVSSEIGRLLKPGGSFSLTFDYLNPSRLARISSPAAVAHQFVEPSGLNVRGNQQFLDAGERQLLHPFGHPRAWRAGWKRECLRQGLFARRDALRLRLANDYTFGALFLARDPA